MMAAKGAVKPVYQVMKDAGKEFDTSAYVPAVAGYYTTPNGQMLSLPFNSSTTGVLLQQGRVQEGGPRSQQAAEDLARGGAAAAKLKAAASARSPRVADLDAARELRGLAQRPFATKENGFGGTDSELKFNGPLQVRQSRSCNWPSRAFVYGGRGKCPSEFISGECAMMIASSGRYGSVKAREVRLGIATMPY